VLPTSATGTPRPPARPGDRGDAAVKGDGEPGELAEPVAGGAVLADVELRGELGDVELADPVPGDLAVADVELGVGDAEAAVDVTVNCSTAMGVPPSAAG
jgi:hypothetical protein